MAVYENLPAYKAAYDLLLEVYKMNVNLTREYRHTLGENLKNELKDLIVCIYKANNADELTKEENLRCVREHIVVIKLYMRILLDLKQVTLKRFVALSYKVEDLYKQVNAWHKSAVKKVSLKHPESSQV